MEQLRRKCGIDRHTPFFEGSFVSATLCAVPRVRSIAVFLGLCVGCGAAGRTPTITPEPSPPESSPEAEGHMSAEPAATTRPAVAVEGRAAGVPSSEDGAGTSEGATGAGTSAGGEPETPSASTDAAALLTLPPARHRRVEASCGKDEGIGQVLAPFKLPSLDGTTVGHRSYRDRVLLVNFWGTWCQPCMEELPEFDQLYRRYRKYGLTLVAIATDTDRAPVEAFVEQRKLGAKILMTGESYALQYQQSKFPFTFLVSPEGKIVGSYSGFKRECMGKLEADIRAQLELRNQRSTP